MLCKKGLLCFLLLTVLLCGCVKGIETIENTTSSATYPSTQTQPEEPSATVSSQLAGPILLPSLPAMPTLPDTVPPIVVPTVPVMPNPDRETK